MSQFIYAVRTAMNQHQGWAPRCFHALFLAWFFLGCASATANVGIPSVFYVDADWSGPAIGVPSAPWTNLTSAAWNVISASLANGPVTVYFNSRQKGTSSGVDFAYASSAAFGPNRFTLDGHSFYNASETTPAWVAESNPASLATANWISSQNKYHLKYSSITVHGFKIVASGNNKAVSIAGDNWIVEFCDISAPAATGGPTVLLVPTADGSHQGSGTWMPPCTNIVIRTNIIHDTYSEAIYLGGGGNFTNWWDAGAGYPSHSYVYVLGNTIHDTADGGQSAGQGDGIDVKGGIDYLTIAGNDIYHINDPNSQGTRPIVMQGQTNGDNQVRIVTGNFIHDSAGVQDAGISVGNGWGVVQGLQIYNNEIWNLSGRNGHVPYGIIAYQSQDTIQVQNNTIYNCQSYGVYASTGSTMALTNNLVWNNNANAAQVYFRPGTVLGSDYNAYVGAWGYGSEGKHSLLLASNQIAFMLASPSPGNYLAIAQVSLDGTGKSLMGLFSNDINGNARGSGNWNIGACQSIPRPSAPTSLQVVFP